MEEILDYATLRRQVCEGLLSISSTAAVEEDAPIPQNPTLLPVAKMAP